MLSKKQDNEDEYIFEFYNEVYVESLEQSGWMHFPFCKSDDIREIDKRISEFDPIFQYLGLKKQI